MVFRSAGTLTAAAVIALCSDGMGAAKCQFFKLVDVLALLEAIAAPRRNKMPGSIHAFYYHCCGDVQLGRESC